MDKNVIVVTEGRLRELGLSLALIDAIKAGEHVHIPDHVIEVLPEPSEEISQKDRWLGLFEPIDIKTMMMDFGDDPLERFVPDPIPKKRSFRFKSPNWNF